MVRHHFGALALAGALGSAGCFQVSGPIDPRAVADDLRSDAGGALSLSQQIATSSEVRAAIDEAVRDAGFAGAGARIDVLEKRQTADEVSIADGGEQIAALTSSSAASAVQLASLLAFSADAGVKISELGAVAQSAASEIAVLTANVSAFSADAGTQLATINLALGQHTSQLAQLNTAQTQNQAQLSALFAAVIPLDGGVADGGVSLTLDLSARSYSIPARLSGAMPTSFGIACGVAPSTGVSGFAAVRQACTAACHADSHVCTLAEVTQSLVAAALPQVSDSYYFESLGADCATWTRPNDGSSQGTTVSVTQSAPLIVTTATVACAGYKFLCCR